MIERLSQTSCKVIEKVSYCFQQLLIEVDGLVSSHMYCYEDLVRVYESDQAKQYLDPVGTLCGVLDGCQSTPMFRVRSRYALVKIVAKNAGMKLILKYSTADVGKYYNMLIVCLIPNTGISYDYYKCRYFRLDYII